MNKCHLHSKINDYLDNRLKFLERTEFEAHLKSCRACAKEVVALQQLSEKLKQWQAPEARPGFEGAVRNKIVAWDLERGEKKMKTKTSTILLPSGVLVSILVLVLVGQVYTKRVVPVAPISPVVKPPQLMPKTPKDLKQAAQNNHTIPMQYEPTYIRMDNMHLDASKGALKAQYEPYYMAGMTDRRMEITQNARSPIQGTISYGLSPRCGGIYDQSMGPQYPPQSEFFEEEYSRIYDNDFLLVKQDPLSTFSIDVDTASYGNLRRFLNNNQLPPADAVRIEEMINYFTYDYPQPTGQDPFSVNTEVSTCPWNTGHKLVLIGLQGKKIDLQKAPASNLVFLIDVSGSMQDYNKLPLLKSAFRLLVDQLRPQDKVSIVVYAGSSGTVLDSVPGSDKQKIIQAIDNLSAGGSTAGASGVVGAYELAKKNFIKDGNNRIILATDGDFNVGITSHSELIRLIEERRNDGIFLTILGFGMGNYKDANMEQMADKGNGSIAYIDSLMEAKKVFVNQLTGTLFTIAKDVKIQVEFNPTQIKAYRLVGYENRKLENKDFNNDKKDAGEMGAGHTVTALYEIATADSKEEFDKTDALKYQQVTLTPSDDLLTVKLRYKEPASDTSKLLSRTLKVREESKAPSQNFTFASSVAEFGLLLRNSQYKANATYQEVLNLAKAAKGQDNDGYRAEFIRLVEIAQLLAK